MPRRSNWSLSVGLFHQNSVNFPLLSHTCHMSRPLHSPWFDLIIIIIGSTALSGPWPSSEASASWSIPAIASSDIVTKIFSRVGLSAPHPTPGYPGGPMFSVSVVSLSWLVPILKRQDLTFCPSMT
jgi:hypothetical protein